MVRDVFRFMTVRTPQRANSQVVEAKAVRSYASLGDTSPLHRDLGKLRNSKDGRKKLEEKAKQYIESSDFISRLSELSTYLDKLERWVVDRRRVLKLDDLKKEVNHIFGMDTKQLVASQDYKEDRRRIADSLIATSICTAAIAKKQPQLIRGMRLCGLLERVAAEDPALNRGSGIEEALSATVMLPGDVFPLPQTDSPERKRLFQANEEEKKRAEKSLKEMAGYMDRLNLLESAIAELRRAYRASSFARVEANADPPSARSSKKDKESPNEREPRAVEVEIPWTNRLWVLPKSAVAKLSKDTKDSLKAMEISLDFVDVRKAVTALELEVAALAATFYSEKGLEPLVRIGNTLLPAARFAPTSPLGRRGSSLIPGLTLPERPEAVFAPSPTVPEGIGTVRPVGIGDLRVVREIIQRYEPGEIAHIENILKGEHKERKHRRTRKTEETFLSETERAETTERDLQSAERYELQLESAETIKEDISLEAGVTATYHGPTIEVTASADFAYELAREESNRAATSYARDVTERSVNRIEERVREQRFRRTVEEFEEINTHGVDNKEGTGHIVGVYRWVDKIYKAQVVSYGRRMMFEFIVPEPAAFFRYIESAKPVEGTTFEKPDPPSICVPPLEGLNGDVNLGLSKRNIVCVSLAPEHITPGNYLFWVAKYQVSYVEPPPPEYKIVSTTVDQQAQATQIIPHDEQEALIKSSKELQLPEGYVAKDEQIRFAGRAEGAWRLTTIIGDKKITFREGTAPAIQPQEYTVDEDGVLPFALEARNWITLVGTVEVICERTKAALEKWQMKTYSAIMAAYSELQSRYEERLRSARIQEGISIGGRNPLRNREIEKTELKRAAISILTNQNFRDFDAVKTNVSPYGYPELDLLEAEAEGRYIQFFEQAFEWRNLTYILYPYFWGRKNEWPAVMQLDDNDPLFAKFLQAGAARVQVPVRRGYDQHVLHYFETGGQIWDGGDPPHVDDPDGLFISIVEEIMEQQGADFRKGEGTISANTGGRTVTGNETDFKEGDKDREILIGGAKYRVAISVTPSALMLTEDYRGPDVSDIPYSISEYHLVGEPWEVRIPTALVYLQEDAKLPDLREE